MREGPRWTYLRTPEVPRIAVAGAATFAFVLAGAFLFAAFLLAGAFFGVAFFAIGLSVLRRLSAACAAARRATGSRYGEQET